MTHISQFSVSMCVYALDDSQSFDIALGSVINQTVKPNEIVLTVDGSIPDTTESIIEKYRKQLFDTDICFKVLYLPENKGHGEARRVCFENCSNELIALMDADDISAQNRFELQLKKFADESELDIVGGNISEFVDEPDNIISHRMVPERDAEIKKYLQKRCPMNQVTVMFRKSSIEKAGGYVDWYCEEDYFLWIRMAQCGMRFGNCPEILVNVRTGEDQFQRRGGVRYFKSEAKLQLYMHKRGVISFPRLFINVSERLVLQVLMPNKLRGYIFKKFARS